MDVQITKKTLGGWVRVRKDVVDAIEVRQLAKRLKIRRAESLGLCVMFWLWADSETDDGLLPDCTPELVDDVVGHPGFAEALAGVGWLLWDEETMVVPNFERHMSESTKRRTLKAERQRRWRARQQKPQSESR